jgi:hypothetical protein
MNLTRSLLILTITILSICPSYAQNTYVDLTPMWDSNKVLKNPHKGWYHHYYDNGINKYLVGSDSDLDNFPGMNHLFLRLAWSFLEPQEGQFNWDVIDKVINKWTAKGYKISFSITAKETGMVYATPKWVKDAGAQGAFYDNWGLMTWEPEFGDPIFLAKLENFHKAFAARYDNKPWIEDIVIGSIGEWGEGHTHFSSKKVISADVITKHIDIYKKYYLNSLIVIGDDYVSASTSATQPQLLDYIVTQGLSFRDDSILVNWYVQTYPSTYSVYHPDYFDRVWRNRPTTLELQHYHMTKNAGDWQGTDGSIKGREILEGAIKITHATFLGYHGYADVWLRENPNLAKSLANKLGYWYFLRSAEFPSMLNVGSKGIIKFRWDNKGVAPAYHLYKLKLKLENSSGSYIQTLNESNNKLWMPATTVEEICNVTIPSTLSAGTYKLKVALVEERNGQSRFIELGMKDHVKGLDKYYEIGSITIGGRSTPTPTPIPELTHTIQLQKNWNLISLPISPKDDDIADLLAPIAGQYAAVHAYNGKEYESYYPDIASSSTLKKMVAGRGYWIYMKQVANLQIKGTKADKSLNLGIDWNLVGYNSTTPTPATQALASTNGKVVVIYSYDVASNSYKVVDTFQPGQGYWIYASENVTWTLP